MNPWAVLGIEACGDVRQIKRAYLARLKHCHPEDDQQAFIELKSAYDYALQASASYQRQEQAPPNRPESPPTDGPLPAGETEVLAGSDDYMGELLDDFARYSDIGAPSPRSRADFVEIDFAAEYDACIDALGRILDDPAQPGDSEAWRSLFEQEILLNLYYRQHFCGELLFRLQNYVDKKTVKNQLTPQVILLLNQFISDTEELVRSLNVSDAAMVTLANLAAEADKHVLHANRRNKSPREKLAWLLWLYFSPSGRIDRLVFTAAWAIPLFILPLLFALPAAMFDAIAAENIDPLSIQAEQYQGLELGSDPAEVGDRAEQVPGEELQQDMTETDAEIRRLANEAYYHSYWNKDEKRWQSPTDLMLEKLGKLDFPELLLSSSQVGSMLVLFWAFLGLVVKRLHDAGYRWYSWLVALVPAIGPVLLLYALYSKPEKFDNKYGAYTGRKARNLKQFRKLVYQSFAAIA